MKKRVLSFNYTLKDTKGQVLDQSTDGPLAFLEGSQQIIPALEEQISAMLIGQKKNVKLAAKDAYGEVEAKMVMDVPKKEVAHLQIEVGSFLQLQLQDSVKVVRIAKITDETVTLDGNHPLAGQDLEFDVELVDSRDASNEELAHGHAHGAGGHHH
ncbi:MAG: FKBP-type peptidyl-prolyl cis-trans isomerase [Pseudobdellovibrionaceae bacterium]